MSVFVLLILVVYGFVVMNLVPNDRHGTFGDTFGGATALFSGLAFAGMFYAVIMQSKELELQREELAHTRKELKASTEQQAKAAEAQQELFNKQMLTAQINGMAAIVQGRYQYAGPLNSKAALKPAFAAEKELLKLLEQAGMKNVELPVPL